VVTLDRDAFERGETGVVPDVYHQIARFFVWEYRDLRVDRGDGARPAPRRR
jgi:hypothetical protein